MVGVSNHPPLSANVEVVANADELQRAGGSEGTEGQAGQRRGQTHWRQASFELTPPPISARSNGPAAGGDPASEAVGGARKGILDFLSEESWC